MIELCGFVGNLGSSITAGKRRGGEAERGGNPGYPEKEGEFHDRRFLRILLSGGDAILLKEIPDGNGLSPLACGPSQVPSTTTAGYTLFT